MDRERANGSVTNRLLTPTVRVFLFLTIATLGCSCAGTQNRATQNNAGDNLYGVRAFTFWSCNQGSPTWFIRDLAFMGSPQELRATIAHEESHKAMMSSFPSCEDYHVWRRDIENRLTLEALGICAAINQRMRDGLTAPDPEVLKRARATAASFPAQDSITLARFMARFRAVCR